jgi:uroporphyrinogen-III synthase
MSPSAAAACRPGEQSTGAPSLRIALGRTTARACAELGLEVCTPARRDAEGVVHLLAEHARATTKTCAMEDPR